MPKPEAQSARKGIMVILSPAKTLNLSPYEGDLTLSTADCDRSKTVQIAKAMKKRKEGDLAKLLGISANLAKTARSYWSNFCESEETRDAKERKPCIYGFSGAAYQGLQANERSEKAILYLQDNVRIVDPLYGVLRPLDRIQPYRLEMATKGVLADNKKIKLADFWKDAVTSRLSEELQSRDNPILLNLASDEYSAAVDANALPEEVSYIKVVFWDQGRVVSVHAKRARGMMARYLADNEVDSLNGVKAFAEEGYNFVASKSDESTLVFDRTSSKRTAGTSNSAKSKRVKR